MENNIKMVSVPRSSNIKEIGYDEELKTLVLKFHHGGVYKYSPVSLQQYLNFLRNPSKGKYFYKNIKNNTSIKSKKI